MVPPSITMAISFPFITQYSVVLNKKHPESHRIHYFNIVMKIVLSFKEDRLLFKLFDRGVLRDS